MQDGLLPAMKCAISSIRLFQMLIMVALGAGWEPETSLEDLLDVTLTYQHQTYAEAVKRAMAEAKTST